VAAQIHGSDPRAHQDREVDDEQDDHDIVEQRVIREPGRDLHNPPERKRADQDRSRQQLTPVVVVRNSMGEIRRGSQKQGRSLGCPSGRPAPTGPDTDREYSGAHTRRDQPTGEVAKLRSTGIHDPISLALPSRSRPGLPNQRCDDRGRCAVDRLARGGYECL